MEFDPATIKTMSLQQFRRFGIVCCNRLGCTNADKRLAKALRKLEQSLGPPSDDQLRRDAFNAANSAYQSIRGSQADMTIKAAIACALVCACADGPNINLLANFEFALSEGELLKRADIRKIEYNLFEEIKVSGG